MIMERVTILVCCLGALGWSGAQAAPVPNPGGDTVVTNSMTATATYVINPVTNNVSNFSTTVTAFLNGTLVAGGSFALPFTDPTVQAAVAAADAVLAANGASYGAPVLFSTATTTSSSTAAPVVPNLSCAQLTSGGYAQNGVVSISQTHLFGPATVPVGTCLQDTISIVPGQLDININNDVGYNVPVNAVTTVASTMTQVYDIFGLTAASPPVPVSVPEPGSAALLLAGAGAIALRQRRR